MWNIASENSKSSRIVFTEEEKQKFYITHFPAFLLVTINLSPPFFITVTPSEVFKFLIII